MKPQSKTIVPFVLRGVPPLDQLNQRLMRKLRKLADRTGSTVEDLLHEGILEFVAKCQTEKEPWTRIIPFPGQLQPSSSRRSSPKGKSALPRELDLNRLTSEKVKESRRLRDVMSLKRMELAAEVERTRCLYTELRQRQGLAWFPT